MKKKAVLVMALFGLMVFSGCGESPDVPAMKSGLLRSGMTEQQANCLAEKMSDTVDGEQYNYMAALMKEGLSETEAGTRTRRKYGADFRTGISEARKACPE